MVRHKKPAPPQYLVLVWVSDGAVVEKALRVDGGALRAVVRLVDAHQSVSQLEHVRP